jgi:HEAT repeat protein
MARTDPGPLIEVLDQNSFPADPELMFVVMALGQGKSREVVEPLSRALEHRDPYVRYEAAFCLSRLRNTAVPALMVRVLRDRSNTVKSVAVEALARKKQLRTPEAIPLLRRLVASQALQRNLPGMWKQVQKLLAEMEEPTHPEPGAA